MKKTLAIASLAIMSIGLWGCNDTAKGMAEDTKENADVAAEATKNAADNVEKTADKMAEDVGEAAKDAAASTLTARIKSALVANPITNDPNVLINVNSTKDVVTLEGHVTSDKIKKEAEEIAKQVLKDTSSTQTLENKLEVK